jgi:hypothetical protein
MKTKTNIVILVISSEDPTYQMLEQSIRDTRAKNIPEDVKVIFCYSKNSAKTFLIDDKLFCNSGTETLINIGYKTIKAFEFINENFEYNYVFRTNLSSYIDINLLREKADSYNYSANCLIYSGVIGDYEGINYCSGSGYFLSKPLVHYIIESQSEWNHWYIDDVALGKLITSLVQPVSGQRWDIVDDSHLIPLEYYHYRVKNASDRSIDIVRMHKIHQLKMA